MSRHARGLFLSKMTAPKASEGSRIPPCIICYTAPQRGHKQMVPPEQRAGKSAQALRAASEKAALLQRWPELPQSICSSPSLWGPPCTGFSEPSTNSACRELMLTEAMNNILTFIIPVNSAFLHPPAPEQPSPEIRSFLLESSTDSSLIRGFSDLTKVTQGGCSRGNPGVLALPALSSTANFHAT